MDPAQLLRIAPRLRDSIREPRMERRTFMAMLTGGIVAPPFAVEAQQAAKVYRVGLLGEKVFRLESSWLGGSWGHIRGPERETGP